MLKAEFRNRVASLYCVDRYIIDDELRRIEAPPLSDEDWERFRTDPPKFFINTDKPTSDAIWRAVEARQ
jgi:hypothetical protein